MTTSSPRTSTWAQWRVPVGLILLSIVPIAAGAARVAQLTDGAKVTPENARFFAMPVPVILHIFSASLYCVFGALQFAPGFRRRRPGWHRIVGRFLVPCGLLVASSGLWMTMFYPGPPGDGTVLTILRLIFGTGMFVSIVLGFAAIRRRDIARHRAWMTRGYAIALGAGTQVLTNLPWLLVLGTPGVASRAVLMGAGWVINLVVAERAVRGNAATPVRTLVGAGTVS